MTTRRDVLKVGVLATTALAGPAACTGYLPRESVSRQPRKVGRALVLWFSQTGNTARIGRLMAAVWRQRGIAVDAAELRDFERTAIVGFGDVKKNLAPVWFSKLITDVHTIDKKTVPRLRYLPSHVPGRGHRSMERHRGQVPLRGLHGMHQQLPRTGGAYRLLGKKLTGYRDFLKQHGIAIMEPIELAQERSCGAPQRKPSLSPADL